MIKFIELNLFDDNAHKKAARRVLTKAFAREHSDKIQSAFYYNSNLTNKQLLSMFFGARDVDLIAGYLKDGSAQVVYRNSF